MVVGKEKLKQRLDKIVTQLKTNPTKALELIAELRTDVEETRAHLANVFYDLDQAEIGIKSSPPQPVDDFLRQIQEAGVRLPSQAPKPELSKDQKGLGRKARAKFWFSDREPME